MKNPIDIKELLPENAELLTVSSGQRLAWQLAVLTSAKQGAAPGSRTTPWHEPANDETECSCCPYAKAGGAQ